MRLCCAAGGAIVCVAILMPRRCTGGHQVRAPQQCVPTQCDHDPHSGLQLRRNDRPQRSGGTGEGGRRQAKLRRAVADTGVVHRLPDAGRLSTDPT